MSEDITNPGFVCTVGPGEKPEHVYLQFGDPGCGFTFSVILTPMQAASLSRDLLSGAEAAQKHQDFASEE